MLIFRSLLTSTGGHNFPVSPEEHWSNFPVSPKQLKIPVLIIYRITFDTFSIKKIFEILKDIP